MNASQEDSCADAALLEPQSEIYAVSRSVAGHEAFEVFPKFLSLGGRHNVIKEVSPDNY